MSDWQVLKKHYDDIQATHHKLGPMNALGIIRTFRNKQFYEEIKKLGHTSAVIELCHCWQKHQKEVAGHP